MIVRITSKYGEVSNLHFGLKEDGGFIDPTHLVDQTVNNTSAWDIISQTESILPKIGGYLYEKFIGGGIEHWASNYIVALPFLVGVSVGVWGLLNMVNSKLASLGVWFVMIFGGIVVI